MAKRKPRGKTLASRAAEASDHSDLDGDALLREVSGDGDRRLVSRLHERIRSAYHGSEIWRDNFVDSMKMLANDQWPDAAKAERDADGRPYLTFNKTTKNILTLAGVQAQSGTEPLLLPFEPDDVIPTHIMSLLVRNIREQNDGPLVDHDVFVDKIGGATGFWKLYVDYGERPQGNIRIVHVNPLSVFVDPNWLDQGWKNARYVFHQIWYPIDEAMERWPDHAEDIKRQAGNWRYATSGFALGITDEKIGDTLSTERFFFDRETQRVAVFECWWKETVMTEVAVYLDTEEVEANPERVKRLKEEARKLPKRVARSRYRFIRRPVTRVRMCDLLGDILLGDAIDSPFTNAGDEFPLFPALGYYFWKIPTSLVDIMKDPQREKNKRRTSIIEMVGRMPLSGFVNQMEQGADPQELTEFMNGHGLVVNYKTKAPELLKPPELPQALVLLEQLADKEIDAVVNVNAELLGNTTQTTVSGRAIEARQRGGMLTHEVLFFTFRREVARYTKFLIRLIQEFMTIGEALRILGAYAIREPQNEQLGEINQLDEEKILEALDRSFSIDYDVVVGTKPYDPTHKLAQWQTIRELRQELGIAIPDDVVIALAAQSGTISKETAALIEQSTARIQAAQAAGAGGAPAPAPAPGGQPPGDALDVMPSDQAA